MKLSEIKSGMVIKVLNEGDVERYLVCDINGVMKAFNTKHSLGEIDYWFDEDLNDLNEEVELLSVYKIIDDDSAIIVAIDDMDSLELIYTREEECDCDEIIEMQNCIDDLCDVVEQLREENDTLRRAISKCFQI